MDTLIVLGRSFDSLVLSFRVQIIFGISFKPFFDLVLVAVLSFCNSALVSFRLELVVVVYCIEKVDRLEPFRLDVVLAEDEKFAALGELDRSDKGVIFEVAECLFFDFDREEYKSRDHKVVVVQNSLLDVAMEFRHPNLCTQTYTIWNSRKLL